VSSYELLHRVAERAAEDHVVTTAHGITVQELEMMQRLEATFDRAVDASLREVAATDLQEQLRKYLADAHAIEEQAIQLLERGAQRAGDEETARIAEAILEDEREAAERIAGSFDEAVEASLETVGVRS